MLNNISNCQIRCSFAPSHSGKRVKLSSLHERLASVFCWHPNSSCFLREHLLGFSQGRLVIRRRPKGFFLNWLIDKAISLCLWKSTFGTFAFSSFVLQVGCSGCTDQIVSESQARAESTSLELFNPYFRNYNSNSLWRMLSVNLVYSKAFVRHLSDALSLQAAILWFQINIKIWKCLDQDIEIWSS